MYITKEQLNPLLAKVGELEHLMVSPDIDWEGISNNRRLNLLCSPRYLFLHLAVENPQVDRALEELQWFKSKFDIESSDVVKPLVVQLEVMLEDLLSNDILGGKPDA